MADCSSNITAAEHSCVSTHLSDSYVSTHLSAKKAKHFIWRYGGEYEPLLIGEGMQKSMKTKLRVVVMADHGTSLHLR